MPVERQILARNDDVYECFPDVAQTESGRLVVVYRESDSHVASEFTHLIVRTSDDDAATWSKRHVLIESFKNDGVLEKWNCPRVVLLSDGRLLIVCDHYPHPPGEVVGRHSINALWFSDDDGSTWTGPQETTVTGIVPDRPLELPSGTLLLGSHERKPATGDIVQFVHRSHDCGLTWEGPITIVDQTGLNPCECSIVILPDGNLVAYMRENSMKGLPGPKAFSNDDGETWDGPYESIIDGCHRPVSGFLKSGNFLTTYRHMPLSKKTWAKNTLAMLEPIESVVTKERSEQSGVILPLDHDASKNSDSAYTGWVERPDGSVFAVNYINDDAPMAQIRGYRFDESDF